MNTFSKFFKINPGIIYKLEHLIETPIEKFLFGKTRYDSQDPFFRCLPNSSEIICEDRIKRVTDIKIGDKVLTNKGNFKQVEKIFKRKYDGEIINIKCRGILSIETTPEHPVLTDNGWKEARYLLESDYIATPKINEIKDVKSIFISDYVDGYLNKDGTICSKNKRSYTKKDEKIVKSFLNKGLNRNEISKISGINYSTVDRWTRVESLISHKGSSRVPNEIKVGKDFLWLSGIYIAEGSASDNGQITFSFGSHEKNLIWKTKNIFKNIFGLKLKERYIINNNVTQLMITNKILSLLFQKVYGKGAKNKRFPHWFLFLPKENQISLLEGLLDGDGSITIDKRKVNNSKASYVTISKNLIWEIFLLLLRLNIISRISIRKGGIGHFQDRIIKRNDLYCLSFNCGSENIFRSTKNFIRCKSDENYIYFKIEKMEKKYYKDDVFNFQIRDDNTFCNPLIVHNCMGSRLLWLNDLLHCFYFGLQKKCGAWNQKEWEDFVQTHNEQIYDIIHCDTYGSMCDLCGDEFKKPEYNVKEYEKYFIPLGIEPTIKEMKSRLLH